MYEKLTRSHKASNNHNNDNNCLHHVTETMISVTLTNQLKITTQRCRSHAQMQSKVFDDLLPIFAVSSQLHHQPEPRQLTNINSTVHTTLLR